MKGGCGSPLWRRYSPRSEIPNTTPSPSSIPAALRSRFPAQRALPKVVGALGFRNHKDTRATVISAINIPVQRMPYAVSKISGNACLGSEPTKPKMHGLNNVPAERHGPKPEGLRKPLLKTRDRSRLTEPQPARARCSF